MLKKIILRTLAVIVIAFVALVIIRIPYVREQNKTVEVVAKIHSTKLTLDDVMGKNLPIDPGAEADKTIAGIDANENGIRDDVEIAIFKAYPNSAKTRAVLLQYALALQMEVVQPIVNTEIVIAVVQEEDRSHLCLGKIISRDDIQKYLDQINKFDSFVKDKELNTDQRKRARTLFFEGLGSYSSLERSCDLDYAKLDN